MKYVYSRDTRIVTAMLFVTHLPCVTIVVAYKVNNIDVSYLYITKPENDGRASKMCSRVEKHGCCTSVTRDFDRCVRCLDLQIAATQSAHLR